MRIELDLTEEEAEELHSLTLNASINTGGNWNLAKKVAIAVDRAESFVDDAPVVNDCRHSFDCWGGYWEKCTECGLVRENK